MDAPLAHQPSCRSHWFAHSKASRLSWTLIEKVISGLEIACPSCESGFSGLLPLSLSDFLIGLSVPLRVCSTVLQSCLTELSCRTVSVLATLPPADDTRRHEISQTKAETINHLDRFRPGPSSPWLSFTPVAMYSHVYAHVDESAVSTHEIGDVDIRDLPLGTRA